MKRKLHSIEVQVKDTNKLKGTEAGFRFGYKDKQPMYVKSDFGNNDFIAKQKLPNEVLVVRLIL